MNIIYAKYMTQKEKELLLKDLSARLPYGFFVHRYTDNVDIKIDNISTFGHFLEYSEGEDFKPYLRLMSSMTEKERDPVEDEISNSWFYINEDGEIYPMGRLTNSWQFECSILPTFEYLYENHLDFRGLIEKGLAIEAPEGMY